MAWTIFDGSIQYSTRSVPFILKRDYPVVMSPNQKWIAYALEARNGKSIELWVAQLQYKQ